MVYDLNNVKYFPVTVLEARLEKSKRKASLFKKIRRESYVFTDVSFAVNQRLPPFCVFFTYGGIGCLSFIRGSKIFLVLEMLL